VSRAGIIEGGLGVPLAEYPHAWEVDHRIDLRDQSWVSGSNQTSNSGTRAAREQTFACRRLESTLRVGSKGWVCGIQVCTLGVTRWEDLRLADRLVSSRKAGRL
jgi:hypothetical protein